MADKSTSKRPKSFLSRHPVFKFLLLSLLAIVLLIIFLVLFSKVANDRRQAGLAPFYDTSDLKAAGQLGEVVRQEPLGVEVPGGEGVRVLYRTQRADGSYTFSSGMILIPDALAKDGKRPVVAWAHGTLGLGDSCAPTRTKDPVGNIAWVSDMLKKGWVVTATDYAGFGTPGTQGYLVGGDEAHDVLNSVRAARGLAGAQAGDEFVIMGHSQGGHSALFSGSQAAAYAPELKLLGTVAEAPAAELVTLLDEQYGTVADWAIGPLLAVSWPAANPAVKLDGLLTDAGRDNYQRLANKCIAQSVLIALVRHGLGQKFFSSNPVSQPAWKAMAERQSAPYLADGQPLMIVESKTDKVVLPNTTALYIQQACQQGSDLSALWLDNVAHQDIPAKSTDQVINWINGRFAGQPAASTCGQPSPVNPAKPVD